MMMRHLHDQYLTKYAHFVFLKVAHAENENALVETLRNFVVSEQYVIDILVINDAFNSLYIL